MINESHISDMSQCGKASVRVCDKAEIQSQSHFLLIFNKTWLQVEMLWPQRNYFEIVRL